MDKRYFTVREANLILPTIKPILTKIMGIHRGLENVGDVSVSFNDEFPAYVHAVTVSEKYYQIAYELYKEIKKLLEIGCIVKDGRIGLVDFYAQFNGEDIFLCYRLGEQKITMWHDMVSGYQGRKPISLLEKHEQQ